MILSTIPCSTPPNPYVAKNPFLTMEAEDTIWLPNKVEMLATLIHEMLRSEEEPTTTIRGGTVCRASRVKSIGAYWFLPADIVPIERLPRFIALPKNPKEFKGPHPVPVRVIRKRWGNHDLLMFRN